MNIHGIQSVGTLTQTTGGPAQLTGSFTGSFKGDGSGLTGISASVNTSNLVTTASFNTYTSSTNTRLNNLEAATSSYAISSSVAAVDISQDGKIASLTALTSSYATTGSNRFNGDQTITGSLVLTGNITAVSGTFTYVKTIYETSSVIYSSGSNQLGDELTDTQILSGSVKVVGGLTLNGVSVSTQSVDITALNAFTASQYVSNSYFATTSSVNDLSSSNYQVDATQSYQIVANALTASNATTIVSQSAWGAFQSASAYSASGYQVDATQSFQITANALTASNATTALSQSLWFTDTTQSANLTSVSGTVYTNTNTIIGLNAKTASYATTGSNSFTGSQIITGSLTITGSVATPPVAVTISSNTASIDFSKGSIYTLTLVSSSVATFVTASNLIPGQTANLLVTQASALSGSLRWASAFKFPTGTAYTGSAVVNAIDLVSFVTINNTTIYSVGAQNLV